MIAAVIVKIIGAVYKIPLTDYIGAQGRGYFSVAYNLCMPIHALTMGAFPLALTKLVSGYEAKGELLKIKALRIASRRLFFVLGAAGMAVMLIFAKPYAELVASSSDSVYTILALSPSVLFSCLCACHRGFSEGYLDMKATAGGQLIEAFFKMIFGLLFARLTMGALYDSYLKTGMVLNIQVSGEKEALSLIYPFSSAAAMSAAALGSLFAYLFSMIYTNVNYGKLPKGKVNTRLAYNELLSFSTALVGATVVQSLCNFADNAGVQYFLSRCSPEVLMNEYSYRLDDIHNYVLGIYAAALDFKNLVPSIVMSLGVTAVPAVSTAYESSNQKFSQLLSGIFKYSVIMSVAGGVVLSLFSKEILEIFYGSSNYDIVKNAQELLKLMGITVLPCSVATTVVYSAQALGFAKAAIPSFVLSGIVRTALNYFLVSKDEINVYGAVISSGVGFLIIVVYNIFLIRKKTNASISFFDVFFKPVICGTAAWIFSAVLKTKVPEGLLWLVLSVIFCLFIYLTLLILTKTLTIIKKSPVKC